MAELIDVFVEATGRVEQVPSDWLGDPVLGKGIRAHTPEAPEPVPVEAPSGPPEVQTTGPVEDLPLIPTVRDAVLAARAAEAEAPAKSTKKRTTKSTAGTAPADEIPATGDKE